MIKAYINTTINISSATTLTSFYLLNSTARVITITPTKQQSVMSGLSVCLVSHNLLYSGLKKAHSKMKSMKKNNKPCMILMSTLGPLPCPSPQSESSSQMMVTRVQKVVYSNLYSQAVTHPSTNRSQPCLTSVIGRELVYSR